MIYPLFIHNCGEFLSSSITGLVVWSLWCWTVFFQAQEAQDDLEKTREDLHKVMMTPLPPPPPAAYEPDENEFEDGESNSSYSADLQTGGINDHRYEEQRITEAEKNERVQKQLLVSITLQEALDELS